MTEFRLHVVAGSTSDLYRIGYFEERGDRSEDDRLSELNRQTSVKGTETHNHQPYRSLIAGMITYSDVGAARQARARLKATLEGAGASFADKNVFTLQGACPTDVLRNTSF